MFVVGDVVVVFRKVKSVLVLVSAKRYFSHPKNRCLAWVFLDSRGAL